MELKRDEIIKAMECCYDNTLSCIDCPFQEHDKYMECSDLTLSALALIKELTEENERLNQSCTNLGRNLDEVRADTVRKMQETFKEEVRKYDVAICTEDAEWLIDQIAKEMLEGTNEEG